MIAQQRFAFWSSIIGSRLVGECLVVIVRLSSTQSESLPLVLLEVMVFGCMVEVSIQLLGVEVRCFWTKAGGGSNVGSSQSSFV